MSSYNLSISPVVNIVYCSVAIIYCCTLICYLYTIVLTKFTRNKDINITRYKLHLSQSIVSHIFRFMILLRKTLLDNVLINPLIVEFYTHYLINTYTYLDQS